MSSSLVWYCLLEERYVVRCRIEKLRIGHVLLTTNTVGTKFFNHSRDEMQEWVIVGNRSITASVISAFMLNKLHVLR